MQETVSTLLSRWESFYVIVGSSGAALTGLQFVVMTLITGWRRRTGTTEIDAFATPTVVHFSVVLVISALLSAPWSTPRGPDIALGILGVGGVIYTAIVTRRARRATGYTPVLEDWIWHVCFPFLAYGTLVVATVLFTRDESDALFAVAGAALLLLATGIHNSWDTVTYISIEMARDAKAEEAAKRPAARPPASDGSAERDEATPVEIL